MTENVPFVVPNDFQTGPDDYAINPQAEVTVILAEGGKVKPITSLHRRANSMSRR